MLGRAIKYGAISLVSATGLAGYSLATGQLAPVNNATLSLATSIFNSVQDVYYINFDSAHLSLKHGTISATKMHARRLKHHKSNFDVVANKFSVQLEEPIMNLLRVDVAEYIRSKDIVVSQLEVSGCKAKLEITKEKTRPKTAEEKAAKMASKKNKPDILVKQIVLDDVEIDVSDLRKSVWAPGMTGVMRKIVRKQSDVVPLPPVFIKYARIKGIRLKHAIFDFYTKGSALGRIGTGFFDIGSGMTSDGDNCTERKFGGIDIPLNTAFNGYLAFPLNLIQQANVDIRVTSRPVVYNASMGSYDYLHEFNIAFKDISSAAPTEDGTLRDATAILVKNFLESEAQKRRKVEINFDLVINESEFNKERISSAVGAALTQKAIEGGLNLLSTFAETLAMRREKSKTSSDDSK